jgi:hypothetical protein
MGKQLKYHPSLFYGQEDIECYVCGSTQYIQRHEVFYGPYRQKSKKYGLWVNLCMKCHDQVHFGKDRTIDNMLKQEAQKRFEEIYNHEKFMEEFDKNRL